MATLTPGQLRIIGANVQGLKDNETCVKKFLTWKKMKPDVFCVVEHNMPNNTSLKEIFYSSAYKVGASHCRVAQDGGVVLLVHEDIGEVENVRHIFEEEFKMARGLGVELAGLKVKVSVNNCPSSEVFVFGVYRQTSSCKKQIIFCDIILNLLKTVETKLRSVAFVIGDFGYVDNEEAELLSEISDVESCFQTLGYKIIREIGSDKLTKTSNLIVPVSVDSNTRLLDKGCVIKCKTKQGNKTNKTYCKPVQVIIPLQSKENRLFYQLREQRRPQTTQSTCEKTRTVATVSDYSFIVNDDDTLPDIIEIDDSDDEDHPLTVGLRRSPIITQPISPSSSEHATPASSNDSRWENQPIQFEDSSINKTNDFHDDYILIPIKNTEKIYPCSQDIQFDGRNTRLLSDPAVVTISDSSDDSLDNPEESVAGRKKNKFKSELNFSESIPVKKLLLDLNCFIEKEKLNVSGYQEILKLEEKYLTIKPLPNTNEHFSAKLSRQEPQRDEESTRERKNSVIENQLLHQDVSSEAIHPRLRCSRPGEAHLLEDICLRVTERITSAEEQSVSTRHDNDCLNIPLQDLLPEDNPVDFTNSSQNEIVYDDNLAAHTNRKCLRVKTISEINHETDNSQSEGSTDEAASRRKCRKQLRPSSKKRKSPLKNKDFLQAIRSLGRGYRTFIPP